MSATSSSGPFRVPAGFMAAVGGFVITTALLKCHQVTYHGLPADSPFTSVPWYLLLVVAEFLLGVWLMTGLYPRVTRLVAMLCFFGLMLAALWLALSGRKSCGCLGQVTLNPWFAVALDLGILAGLVFVRLDGPERTIRTHGPRFYGFLLAALGFGVPGFMTMAVYRREPPKPYSLELRHDPLVHNARVAVKPQQPTAEDLVALVAAQAGISLSVDDAVREHFDACNIDWESIGTRSHRGWALLEAVTKGMPVQSRWLKTEGGYVLIGDSPLRRAKSYWFAGLAFGAIGSCWLAWNARRGNSMAGRSADVADSPVEEASQPA